MKAKAKIRTCLWFDDQAEEAAEFYVSVVPDSEIERIIRPDPNGPALIVEFTLAGTPYMTFNGGPHFEHTPAASISVLSEDQEEVDRLWSAVIAEGGKEGQCAWLTDRFGVSWQIVPKALPEMLTSDDRTAATRAREAMMQMKKIDVAALEAAFRGN